MQPITPLLAFCPSENAVDLQVVRIDVKKGERVRAGQVLMLIEFRKVVVEIAAPSDGVVEEIYADVWDEVQVGDRLMDFRPAERAGDASHAGRNA